MKFYQELKQQQKEQKQQDFKLIKAFLDEVFLGYKPKMERYIKEGRKDFFCVIHTKTLKSRLGRDKKHHQIEQLLDDYLMNEFGVYAGSSYFANPFALFVVALVLIFLAMSLANFLPVVVLTFLAIVAFFILYRVLDFYVIFMELI